MTPDHDDLIAGPEVERDIFEVANQLMGYVDPGTEEDLARFLIREGKAAAVLADEIVKLRASTVLLTAERDEAHEALSELVDTLTPAEHVPVKDPAYGDRVRELGKRIGFGALMAAASGEWRAVLAERGDPLGSEFVCGPCRAVLEHDMNRARKALANEEDG